MALGDQADMVQRLKALLPPSWFGAGDTPVLDTVLTGLATPFAWSYALYSYTLLQMRRATATGVWLDRIAYDFLGTRLKRRTNEQDDDWRGRIGREIMRERQTRAGIIAAVHDLTGTTPLLYEPWNPGDCGGYGMPCMGYGVAGCYGSLALNNQIFVTAVRPVGGASVPNVGGFDTGPIGYGVAGEIIDMSEVTGPVTDADIYASVADTVAAGMTGWVDIVDALPTPPDTTTPLTADGATPTADNGTLTADHY